jgi:hypothetical protein
MAGLIIVEISPGNASISLLKARIALILCDIVGFTLPLT